MPKKKTPKSRRQREQGSSGLESHRRQGKKLVPPLMTLPNLSRQDWFRDILPNMLLLCSRATFDVRAADSPLHPALRLVRRESTDSPLVDGTLVSFGRVTESERSRVLDALVTEGLYEEVMPEELAHAFGLYPDAPGYWLIGPHQDNGLHLDPELGHRRLEAIVRACFHGQSEAATRAKVLFLSQYMMEGRVKFPRDMEEIELLTKPIAQMTSDERAQVDSTIRAMFGALYSAETHAELASDHSYAEEALDWAKRFWRANFALFPCREWPELSHQDSLDDGDVDDLIARFREQAEPLADDFGRRAGLIDPDLYEPDRFEVLAGIGGRAARRALLVSGDPLLWTPEVITPLLREVVECLIVASWMMKHDELSVYEQFKDYGRGHLKLLKLHLEEATDAGEDANLLENLSEEVNADLWEEFQTIDLSGGFSGRSIRDMAIDADLKQEYDLIFAPASAQSHGEWTALDRYQLARCAEPLHRLHRRPRLGPSDVVALDAVDLLLQTAERVAGQVLSFLEGPRVG